MDMLSISHEDRFLGPRIDLTTGVGRLRKNRGLNFFNNNCYIIIKKKLVKNGTTKLYKKYQNDLRIYVKTSRSKIQSIQYGVHSLMVRDNLNKIDYPPESLSCAADRWTERQRDIAKFTLNVLKEILFDVGHFCRISLYIYPL